MAKQSELREFLKSRRARLTPPDVGLPWHADGRRVAGLRREEIAVLAGVSADYYTRLEQGRARNVSDQVLDAVAAALKLDEVERRHLFDLVRTNTGRPSRAPVPSRSSGVAPLLRARPALLALLASLDPTPAVLHGPRLEVAGINRMGKILLDDFDSMPTAQRNMARWMFLNPRAREVYPDWEEIAEQTVAILRVTAGRDATDPALSSLVGELSTRSDEFARYWANYRVFQHTYGTKRFRHPAVGDMTLSYETLHPAADSDLYVTLYAAAHGSTSEEKLRILSSWSVTPTDSTAGAGGGGDGGRGTPTHADRSDDHR
ncbi:helix-turn-helix transcriptional regulator [Streptomyces sp. NPDC002133]|uniref:helix-turn-helix transcriptional regulator n=1 Tax=Streptomyces sp. NPDC002133 TaxID=3154409 RepID=UPI0033295E12